MSHLLSREPIISFALTHHGGKPSEAYVACPKDAENLDTTEKLIIEYFTNLATFSW